MQLLIRQRVFSWTDTYDVYDEDGNPKYFVKAELLTLGHQIHVYDRSRQEIGMIRQKVFSLLPVFDIEELKNSFLFSSRNTNWITMAGVVKAIFWHGIMMSTMPAVSPYIFPKKSWHGVTPM